MMKIVALRCSNTDFVVAIVEGTRDAPIVKRCEVVGYPKGYDEGALLHWFHQELTGILARETPECLAVKAAETMVKRSATLELRIRIEGIAAMSASAVGCTAVRKVKSTIAKDLGLKGKGRYLETKLDTSPISDFESFPPKSQEAILVGWSCLG